MQKVGTGATGSPNMGFWQTLLAGPKGHLPAKAKHEPNTASLAMVTASTRKSIGLFVKNVDFVAANALAATVSLVPATKICSETLLSSAVQRSAVQCRDPPVRTMGPQ
jgi:hypothetical protein